VVSKNVSNFVWTPAPGGGRYYDQVELWNIR
jgi:peptide/nickel transport system substrate-binding protein